MRWSVSSRSSNRGLLRYLDLRFSDRGTEKAFCDQRAAGWPLPVVLGQVALQVAVSVHIFDDTPGPTHIIYFSLQCLAAVALTLLSMACCFKLGGISWSSESFWSCVLALSVVSGVLHQRLPRTWLGTADSRESDIAELEISVCLLSLCTAIYCHVLPMRCCFLAPLVALSSISLVLQGFDNCGSIGALQPRASRVLLSLALLALSYRTAYRCEHLDREQWLQGHVRERQLRDSLGRKELTQAVLDRDLKILRSYGCTLAFGLQPDFRICCGSIHSGESFFGMDLMGQSVLHMMNESNDFTRLCQESQGSRMPRALRITLLVKGQPRPALLVLLHYARAGKEYLMGIKLEGQGVDHLARADSPRHPFAPQFSEPQAGPEDEGSEESASDSLCYTSSLEVLHADCATDTGPAIDAVPSGLGDAKATETNIVWSEAKKAFQCRNCRKPPRPREEVIKQENPFEGLVGIWEVQPQFREIAQPFIKRLVIQADGTCIDALGQKRQINGPDASGDLLLLKGRIWLSDGTLFREGRSGIVMRFDPVPEHPLFGDTYFEDEEEEQEEEDQETDLHILESLVGGSNRSDRNFLR